VKKTNNGPANQKRFAPDGWLFFIVLALLTFGIVLVFDASYPIASAYGDYQNNPFFFAKRQLLSAGIGLACFFAFSFVPYWNLRRLALIGFVTSIVLLLVVWKLGHASLGARRWLAIGPLVIQPSEVAKLSLVLFLSWLLAEKQNLLKSGWKVFWLSLAVAIPLVLTERQPDLGTATTMFLTFLILLITAGARGKYVGIIAAVSLLGVFITLKLPSQSHPDEPNYRMKRMLTFIHPEQDKNGDGYQIWRSLVGLGNGGWTGQGLGRSNEKRPGGVPAQRTDFIFAIIGEELGLVGTASVLLGFLILTVRGLSIAMRTRDPFGRYLATGLTAMVSLQALINMAVVTASAPTTGIPLPLISYGGSSLIPTLCGLGILLGISRYPGYRQGATAKEKPSRSDNFFSKEGIK